jgi:outer membrane lipoprotein SlyB
MKENIMRFIAPLLVAALTLAAPSLPAAAKSHKQSASRYQYDGRYYNSLAQCQAAKRKARKDGTIVGAAVAGVGAAVLGANLGETALIAGGGALVGNSLGNAKKC